jgi:hypothetical protein
VVVLRVPIRFGPETVTVTPGSGVPCGSVIVPLIAPVSLDCEKAKVKISKKAMTTNRTAFFMLTSFKIP